MKKSASADDIRKAFRKLARKYHPDVNPGDKSAEEKFKTLSEANDVLSDPKKRKIYDQVGFYSDNIDPATAEAYARAGGGSGGTGGFPGGAQDGGQGVPFDFGGFDFSDLVDSATRGRRSGGGGGGGSFRDIFGSIFGGGHGAAQAEEGPEPGTDLEYQVNVPFWTAIRGGVMRLNISRHDVCATCHGQGHLEAPGKCPECNGTGQITQTGGRMKFNVQCPRCHGTGKNLTTCPTCHGEGTVTKTEPLEVRIKAGTRDGQRIRVPGKGNAGAHGGTPGDLYAIIRTEPHPDLPPRRRRHLPDRAGQRHRSRAGSQDRSADDRRPGAAEDSPRDAVGPEAAPAGKGCAVSHERRRARGRDRRDHGHGVHAPRRAHERTAARAGQAESGRPAGGIVEEGLKLFALPS